MIDARKVSVIIPFFQRENGILKNAITSIIEQIIPEGWCIEIVLVDDGSPCLAQEEIGNIIFPENISLIFITQANSGVAVARNTGLCAASTQSDIIAFLDSDDTWPNNHISRAVEALNLGFDFSFADNVRVPYHQSYISACAPITNSIISHSKSLDGLVEISKNEMLYLLLREFPCQISTVTFRGSLARDIRFDTSLNICGEDTLYLCEVIMKLDRVCFNKHGMVNCGKGVNIFFSHFSWDDPEFLSIKRGQLLCHAKIKGINSFPQKAAKYNSMLVRKAWYDFAYHSLRLTIKNRRIPEELVCSMKEDSGFFIWFPVGIFLRVMEKFIILSKCKI